MLYEFKPALFYFSQQNQHLFSILPTGENEGQEQAGAPSAWHHQRKRDEGRREDQGGHSGMEPDQHQTMGSFTQELYPCEFFMEVDWMCH